MNAVDLFEGYVRVSVADWIRNEWQVLARMSRWEWRRKYLAGLGTSNECLMKGWQKRFIMEKWVVREVGGKSQLTFENTVLKILEEGHVKSMRTSWRTYMKRLMTVDEAKEVCRDCSVWRSVLSDYPARDKAWS